MAEHQLAFFYVRIKLWKAKVNIQKFLLVNEIKQGHILKQNSGNLNKLKTLSILKGHRVQLNTNKTHIILWVF